MPKRNLDELAEESARLRELLAKQMDNLKRQAAELFRLLGVAPEEDEWPEVLED